MRNLQLYLNFALREILKLLFVKRQVLVIISFFSVSMFVNAQPIENNSKTMQKDSLEDQVDKDESQLQKIMKRSDVYFFRLKGKLVFTKDKNDCLMYKKTSL
jgi:hypothetical protein